MAKKKEKYFVLKLGDIAEFLSKEKISELYTMAEHIHAQRKLIGKKESPEYIVCNQDEPYAEDVWRVILNGEEGIQKHIVENFANHLGIAIDAYKKLQLENDCLRKNLLSALEDLNGATYCFTRGGIGAEQNHEA